MGGVHFIYRGPGGAPWGTPNMFTVICDCFIYLNQGVNIYYHILNIPSPTQTTSGVLIAPIWLFKAPKTCFARLLSVASEHLFSITVNYSKLESVSPFHPDDLISHGFDVLKTLLVDQAVDQDEALAVSDVKVSH